MKDLSDLVNDLSDAINQALWRSSHFADAAAALEEALGDFRISIDLLVPQAENLSGSTPAFTTEPTPADKRFLHSIKVKI